MFILQYIDKKYILILSNYLTLFSDNGNEVYNFRCPYCGDSKKNKFKKRGYIVYDKKKNGYFYKCWNCGTVRNLASFIKDQRPALYNEYRKDKFSSNFTKPAKVEVPDFSTKPKFNTDIGTKLIRTLTPATDNTKAYDYCKGRMLPQDKIDTLYYTDDITKITSQLDNYKEKRFRANDALVIPFRQTGVITHLQLRILDNKDSFKYVTIELNDTYEKVYGMDEVNPNECVYVFEGPIDSMFCNGIALAQGALHKKSSFLKSHFKKYVFVYDKDFVNNKDILASMQKCISMNEKVVLYDKTILNSSAKDLNDIVKMGLVTDITKYLENNTYKGLPAKMYLNKIKQIQKSKNSNFTEILL